MARPIKIGLDYFPVDTKLDKKLKLIKAKYKLLGIGFVDMLLRTIYSEGYYIILDDETLTLLCDEFGLDERTFLSMLEYCLAKELFDKNLYEKDKVLTSTGIQNRYFHKTLRRSNGNYEYVIIDIANSKNNNNEVSANNNEVSASNNATKESKVNESKEEESKEKKSVVVEENIRQLILNFFKANKQDTFEAEKFLDFNKDKKLHSGNWEILAKRWIRKIKGFENHNFLSSFEIMVNAQIKELRTEDDWKIYKTLLYRQDIYKKLSMDEKARIENELSSAWTFRIALNINSQTN